MSEEPFWRVKRLDEMTKAEWEQLCDGCAKCCLVKLEDEETDELIYTDVGCDLLDAGTCRCTDYPNRNKRVPDCIPLTPEIGRASWRERVYILVAAVSLNKTSVTTTGDRTGVR